MDTQITAQPKIFIGLDIHKKSWTVSIQTDLFFHKTYSMPSKVEDLEHYVTNNFHNHDINLVYEAGCCGFYVARYFFKFRLECISSQSS